MNVRNLPEPGPIYEEGAEGWYWKLHIDKTWHGPYPSREAAEDAFAEWAADQWRQSNNLSSYWNGDAA